MQCYTQLTPPTAVTHCLSLPFLSASANNLVVAKTSLLQIFSLKTTITQTTDRSSKATIQTSGRSQHVNANGADLSNLDSTTLRGERLPTTKLVLVAQYELSGAITSLARVKILQSKSGGEALLVALKDAKLSLIEWDPERYSVSTISIHYYEREDILSSPWEPDLGQCVNYLSVDPSSRCAILKFGTRNLAILPFHQQGDDLVMDDYDPDIDGEIVERKSSIPKPTATTPTTEKTPYAASFVLSLLALDPTLSHPVHLSFLHEYREPTFGVLYSQVASSSSLLYERRDNVSYAVFNLDLEEKASTTLLSVNNLPWDTFAVFPLLRSIGGALLLGSNQVIHVDQSGKTSGIAVNDFAKQSTSFPLADQSGLNMRLENCIVKELGIDGTDLLLILNTGELAILSFMIDGRSVSGLSIRPVQSENGGGTLLAGPSCASIIGRGRLFVGSEDSDSKILGWSRKNDRLKRKRSIAEIELDVEEEIELDDEDMEIDEDDLYADTTSQNKGLEGATSTSGAGQADYVFRVHDSLSNTGPMTGVALRSLPRNATGASILAKGTLGSEILASSGRYNAGSLTSFRQGINVELTDQYDIDVFSAQVIWTVDVKEPQKVISISSSQRPYHKCVFISSTDDAGTEKPVVYRVEGRGLEEVHDIEFDEDAGKTVDISTINNGTVIAQVSQNQLRTYDTGFNLSQIQPLAESESDVPEPKVISASFADPYIVIIRDDRSAALLTADERGEFDEENRDVPGKWVSGSLYEDSNDNLRLEFPDDSEDEAGNVFRLPNVQKPVYVADGLSFLPPFLSRDFNIRRSSGREKLVEILVAELGDATHKSSYLILRTSSDDLIIYQPYQTPKEGSKETDLRFLKISNSHIPKKPKEDLGEHEANGASSSLRVLHDVGGYSAVFKRGTSPSFIIKSASSQPNVFDFVGPPVTSLSALHTLSCENGMIYIDEEGKVRNAQLPRDCQYETGWVTRRIPLGEEVHALSYHEEQDAFLLGTSTTIDFKLPEDDFHHHWSDEDTKFLPQVEQGAISLLDGKTHEILDSHALEPYEIITTMKTLSLETSEITHTRAPLIVAGTALLRGEDLPSAGHIYIFALISVVPDPSLPHTDRALKLVAKEETKGAVTAVSSIGTQGFLLVAQGQKCMVRGLKEDGTLLPVAFMDMQCFVGVVKELEGTGLCLMGDAVKGVWFSGYMEEPYQLRLFGKSPHHIEVVAADFIPDGKQLYMAVADADCNIHILQFDPENPKSLSGQRLLHHTTFHTGHYPSTLTLLPSFPPTTNTTTTSSSTPTPSRILLTHPSGSLALLSSLSTSSHRTLSALQSHLQATLPHHLGLNPRSYRLPCGKDVAGRGDVMGGGGGGGVGRGGIVDGGMVRRWREGGRWRWWGGGVDGGGVGEDGGEGEGEGDVRGLVRWVMGKGLF